MALRFERKDGQSAEVDEARVTKVVWKDDDGTEHEVEGHGFRNGLSDEGFRGGLSDEADVEGHGFRGGLSDEPDVEIQKNRFRRSDLDKVVRVAWKDDDGTEHDVEGHGFRRGLSDDVEGHGFRGG